MGRPGIIITFVAVVAVLAAAAGGVAFVMHGERYRVYTDRHAGHCWAAVQRLLPPNASPSLVQVAAVQPGADDGVRVRIGYRLERVLAGAELEAVCAYPGDRLHAESIVLNGSRVDAETLEDVNRELAAD